MKAARNIVVLLTGGIGSGKSLASRYLTAMGVPVYDFDSRTKELYDSDVELCRKVAEAVRQYNGEEVLAADGHLDRQKLAHAVFGNHASLDALEAVVHPAVLADFRNWREACDSPIVVAESAIALSKPLFANEFDKVILITAPEEVRKSRVTARDGLTDAEVSSRMLAQTPAFPASPSPKVDFVIDNNGDTDELKNKLSEIIKQI